MNERIRELKEQAFNFVAKQSMVKKEYFWENIRHDRTLQDKIDEKFAELIVQECIEKITTYNLIPGHSAKWEDIYDIHTRLLQDLGKELKQHFGVDE